MGWILDGYRNGTPPDTHSSPAKDVVSEYPPMPLPPRTGQSHPPRVAAGIDPHDAMEGGPEILHYPVASHMLPGLLPPPSLLRLVLALAWPRLASHMPHANNLGRRAVSLSGPCCNVHAICLPSFSAGIIVHVRQYHGTCCLSICLSTIQSIHLHIISTNRAAARPPELAKVGNGAARFGLLFGRGTVSPSLPAVLPSCILVP